MPTGSEAAQFEAALPGGGEVIRFDINSAVNISGAAISFNILNFIGISDFDFKLVQDGGVGAEFSTFTVLAFSELPGGVLTLSYSGLTSGTYGFLFTGKITGSLGGFYAGKIVVATVPLPPAVWLFLSALIGLVGVARKKSKRTIATTTRPTEAPLGA